jgi:hypothetical protein
VAGRRGGLIASEIDLLSEQIVHQRRAALVRNGGEFAVDRRHEHDAAQMRSRSQPGIRQRDLVPVRLQMSQKVR